MTIYKYFLDITEEQQIELPHGATALSVGNQRNSLCLWALVDTSLPMGLCTIYIHGTGMDIDVTDAKRFIGSVTMDPFVWHVFVEARIV